MGGMERFRGGFWWDKIGGILEREYMRHWFFIQWLILLKLYLVELFYNSRGSKHIFLVVPSNVLMLLKKISRCQLQKHVIVWNQRFLQFSNFLESDPLVTKLNISDIEIRITALSIKTFSCHIIALLKR